MSPAAAPRACRRCGQPMALENSRIERGVLFRRWACACGEGALDRHPVGRRLVETVSTGNAAADAVLSDEQKERLEEVLAARRTRTRLEEDVEDLDEEEGDDDEDLDEEEGDDDEDLDEEAPRSVAGRPQNARRTPGREPPHHDEKKEKTMSTVYSCDKCDAVFDTPRKLSGHRGGSHIAHRARPCGCAPVGPHRGGCSSRTAPRATGAILPSGIASGATPAPEPAGEAPAGDPFALLLESLESAARRVRDDPSPQTIRECREILSAVERLEAGRREAKETAES